MSIEAASRRLRRLERSAEDARHEFLAELPTDAHRKLWLIMAYSSGRISDDELAFWIYVFDLRSA